LIHLYIKGYKTTSLTDFELHLTNPSHINELQELEATQARLDIFASAKEMGALSTYYLYKNVLKLTDDEIESEEKNKIRDRVLDFCLENASVGTILFPKDVLDYNKAEGLAAAGAADEGGFGGGMGGGGDFGGDFGDGDEFGDDMGNEDFDNPPGEDLELPDELENLGGDDEV